MTPTIHMEQRSIAFIRAVAVDAGCQVVKPEIDDDSVDGILMARFGRRPRLEFQAKATSQDVLRVRDDNLHFPLSIKNYNDLRLVSWTPRILIVVRLPDEAEPWLSQTEDELCMRYGAYWLSLAGMPETPNTASVTVTIPRKNLFDRAQLEALMNRVKAGGSL